MSLHINPVVTANSVNLFVEQAHKGLSEDQLFQLYEPFKVFRSIINEAYKMQSGQYLMSSLTLKSEDLILFNSTGPISKVELLQELVLILGSYKNVSVEYDSGADPSELLPLSALILVIKFLQSSSLENKPTAREIFTDNDYIFQFYSLYNAVYSNIPDVHNTTLTLLTILKNVKLVDGRSLGNEDILFASKDFYLVKGEVVKINEEVSWNQNVVNLPKAEECAFKVSYSPGIYMKKPGLNINPEFDSGRSSLRHLLK